MAANLMTASFDYDLRKVTFEDVEGQVVTVTEAWLEATLEQLRNPKPSSRVVFN